MENDITIEEKVQQLCQGLIDNSLSHVDRLFADQNTEIELNG